MGMISRFEEIEEISASFSVAQAAKFAAIKAARAEIAAQIESLYADLFNDPAEGVDEVWARKDVLSGMDKGLITIPFPAHEAGSLVLAEALMGQSAATGMVAEMVNPTTVVVMTANRLPLSVFTRIEGDVQ